MARKKTTKTDRARAIEHVEELLKEAPDDESKLMVARDAVEAYDLTEYKLLFEMADELGVKPWDLDIEESKYAPNVYVVKLGNVEYNAVLDEDVAVQLAKDQVRNDLEQEPEIFNRDFIERHIDMESLTRWVRQAEMESEYVEELANHQVEDFWRLARQLDVDGVVPDHDEDGDEMEPSRKQVEAVKEAYADDRAREPMEFFRDIYGDEAAKHAIDAAGLDIDSAVEEAVSSDGWQHFISRYDGKSNETPSGFIYWRD